MRVSSSFSRDSWYRGLDKEDAGDNAGDNGGSNKRGGPTMIARLQALLEDAGVITRPWTHEEQYCQCEYHLWKRGELR